jgi:hypothetical protein
VNEPEGRGLPLRAFLPNAVTVLALCSGLTGIRFAFGGEWDKAMIAIVVAGVLDGLDGRIARMLKANSKFGAELDSLSDNIAFGTAPALILFQWSLTSAPKFGWTIALALAVSCALRLEAGHAVDAVCRGTHDLRHPDLQLDLDPHPQELAGRRAGRYCPARGGPDQRTVDHTDTGFARLSRDRSLQHRKLCPRQAAARHSGFARADCDRSDGWRPLIRTVTGRVSTGSRASIESPLSAATTLALLSSRLTITA